MQKPSGQSSMGVMLSMDESSHLPSFPQISMSSCENDEFRERSMNLASNISDDENEVEELVHVVIFFTHALDFFCV